MGNTMMENAWLVPVFPLISFLFLLLIGQRLKENSAYIGIVLTFISFIFSVGILMDRLQGPTYKAEGTWLKIGDSVVTMGFEVNPLNALMTFIVSLVSFLVHVYSKGYMHGDGRFHIFYAYLGLFTFAMQGLVLSPNLLQLYIFWELVGVGSFLLIGFYFYKKEAKAAAKKAFIMTRIGDVGLFIGIILLFWQTGSFEYAVIFEAVRNGEISGTVITLTSILIFIGAVGKSGQLPLHTWLPDAMEGPTPVSALIHAATMVAAGVYLVAAMFPLFSASETAMTIVATVGAVTAIFAASIGLVQSDIKRILAYSTVSQLGYMMLALGSAGYIAGVFHLMTHAFFKALLFLAAGSVIHAVHTQNIEEMGGLWSKIRFTGILFLTGALAISGVPFFSGFFSKEEILLAAWADGNYILFFLAVLAALFTAFYMFRLFFLVFWGEAGLKGESIHESPAVMVWPMGVLAVLAVCAGYVQTPWTGTYLGDWLTQGRPELGSAHIEGPVWIMLLATAVSFIGIFIAYKVYGRKDWPRDWLSGALPMTYAMLKRKYYADELYEATIIRTVHVVSLFGRYIEEFLVKGFVALVVSSIDFMRRSGSRFHNGQIQRYGTVAFLGLAVLILILALSGGYFS
jgi:NADH-quinone oxidoreductase subunit L